MPSREEIKKLVDQLNENPQNWEDFIKVLSESSNSILMMMAHPSFSSVPCGIGGRGDILVGMMIGLFQAMLKMSPEMGIDAFRGITDAFDQFSKEKMSKGIPIVIVHNEYKS